MYVHKRIKLLESLLVLCGELNDESDGVKVPRSMAAVLNGIRAILEKIDELDGEE